MGHLDRAEAVGSAAEPDAAPCAQRPRLIGLSLRGFKSFRSESTILFAPTLTGIVGPNGSGKSNIVDALRWVSGERSRQAFRVSQTSDIVHLGPAGRLAWARVSLRIDPAGLLPWSEVGLSRTLHADGTQEFHLNGARARLRDIEAVLDRLGVLSFIVSQGEVEWLLELRPLELRERLETALGLAAVKGELARAREDLQAAQDLLVQLSAARHELVPRVRTLERLVKQGQEWRELEARARRLAAQVYWRKLSGLQEEEREARARLEELEAEVARLDSRISSAEMEARTVEEELSALRTDLERADAELSALSAEQASDAARLQVVRRAYVQNQERTSALLEHLKRLSSEADGLSKALEEGQRRRAHLLGKRDTLRRDLAALGQELSALQALREGLLGQHLAEAADLELEVGHTRADLRSADEELWELGSRVEGLAAAVQMSRQAFEAVGRELETLGLEEARVREEWEALETEAADAEGRARELEAARDRAVEAVRRLEGRLEQLRREIAGVRERLARLDGVPRPVAELVAAREAGQLAEIVGPVAHLLEVPHEYALAVWSALGARRWHVVTESWRAAVAAVEHLRELRIGRATFLPLDTLRPPAPPEPPAAPGIVGRASDLVRAPAALRPVIQLLLGKMLVVEDLEVARRLFRRVPGFTLVTLAGDVLRPTGELTGGWDEGAHGPADQRARLAALEQEEMRLTAEVEQVATRRQEAEDALEVMRARLRSLRSGASALQAELQALSLRKDRLEQERRAAAHDLEAKGRSLAEAQQRRRELEERRRQLRSRLEDVEGRLRADGAARAEALARAREVERTAEELRERMRHLGAADAALREELEAVERELATLEVKLRETRAVQVRMDAEVAQLRRGTEELAEQLAELESRVSARDGRIRELSERREALSNELRSKVEQAQACADRLGGLKSAREHTAGEGQRLSSAIARLRSEAEDVELKAREELGRGWQGLLGDGAQEEAPDRALAEVRARQRKLVLPDPEMEAEYLEVHHRLVHLEAQLADVSAAVHMLSDKVGELEGRARSGWDRGLRSLRNVLKGVWCELFGGGSADLVEDGDGRVRLEALPPGKRVKSLGSLSGGEKALASMALLISMLEVGSFPVCILDEVDASLDDVRAGRLAGLLTQLAGRVQFVVVTHNRQTIQACEALYGLTTDADGATRVLSLKVWDAAGQH